METEPYEDSRTQRQLTKATIDDITSAYHSFRNHGQKAIKADGTEITYEDNQGFWKVATVEEIREKDYNLTPASYVGIAQREVDEVPFNIKMSNLTSKLYNLMKESSEIDIEIKCRLKEIGYGEDEVKDE